MGLGPYCVFVYLLDSMHSVPHQKKYLMEEIIVVAHLKVKVELCLLCTLCFF